MEIIDAGDLGYRRTLGAVERLEGAILPEIAMLCAIVIPESARDLAIIIDPSSLSSRGPRGINCGKNAFLQKKEWILRAILFMMFPPGLKRLI